MSDYKYTQTDPNVGKARLSIWMALIGIIVLVIWASFAKIDQVTRAKATVIASAKTQEIQASEGGILKELKVKEGDAVKKGDLLIILEDERAQAQLANSATKVAALKAKVIRLEAEIFEKPLEFSDEFKEFPDYVENQVQLYNRRRQAINQEVASLKKMQQLAEDELGMNKPLLEHGDVSRADIIKLERQVADIESQIRNKRNKYFEEAQAEMTKAQEDLSSETEQLRDRAQVLEEKRLMAPTEGIVNNINVTTIGGVVRPADIIMQLSPTSSELVVEAKVSPVDISNVKINQNATVKLDAYDYSIFGAMTGQVFYISEDTLVEKTQKGEESYYKVRIKIGPAEFADKEEEIVIRPGMTASIDIKARERTVLSYLTKPITKTLSESLGEK